jgi:hypothetical protein
MYYDRPQAGIFLSNGSWMPLITGPILNLNTWNTIRFTYDNKNAKLYVNGVVYSQSNVNRNIVMNDNPIYIGNKLDFTRNFAGYIDYITLSN